jgi:hypothetical protein
MIVVVTVMVVAVVVMMVVMRVIVMIMRVVIMIMIMVVVMMIMRAVVVGRGIGAAFGIERRLDGDHLSAEPARHLLDDMIAPDAQRTAR